MHRCATLLDNVTVILASVLLTVHSPEAEAVTIVTRPRLGHLERIPQVHFEHILTARRLCFSGVGVSVCLYACLSAYKLKDYC